MKKYLIFVVLFILVKISYATNYYVSSSTGNDANPGTITQPWKTIVKLNSFMPNFRPGDSILYKKGDTFTIPEGVNTGGMLMTVNGNSSLPIVISSYGTGAMPILTLPPITSWSGGPVYTASWTIQTCCSILYEDGIPLLKASSSACTDGNWYGASGTLYYKPTSGTPANHTITVANINNSYIPGIDLSNRQYVTVTGIQFNSIGIGVKTFETSHGTVGLKVTNCVFNYCQSGVFMMPDTGNNNSAVITNNLFYRCQVGVRFYTVAAIGSTKTTGTHIACKILYNEMSQCGTTDGNTHWQSSVAGTDYEGIGVQNFVSGTISNNYIHDGYCIGLSWYNISTRTSDNNVIQNNQILNNQKGALILIGASSYNYGYSNNLFSNNLFSNTNSAPGNGEGTVAIYQGTITNIQNLFVNNTLVGTTNNIALENGNPPYFTIENNIISGTGNNFVTYSFSVKPPTLTIDYNLYYPGTTWILGSNKNLAQMQGLGMELHSLTANPLFVNTSANNYQLQPNSPAINTGINVGLPFTGPAPDMGAYEYQSSSSLCGPFTNHAPIALTGASFQTISGYSIVATLGAPAISLTNCHDMVIKLNSLTGNCTPGQNANTIGVQLYNCYNITIDSNNVSKVATGVYAINCTGNIVTVGNQFQNMTGPSPRGQGVQYNGCSGSGNFIQHNIIENLPGASQPADAINVYNSNGTSSSNISVDGNEIRETGSSASSISGGGVLLGDGGGSYQSCTNNIAVNSGHFLFGVASGTNMTIANNQGYLNDPVSINPVGVQVANLYSTACGTITVTGNRIYCLITATGVLNPYWIPSSGTQACSPVTNVTNTWSDATLSTAILPTVLIPVCVPPAPVISYSPNVYTYYINSPITPVTPINTGGTSTSWAIVPVQPAGLSFNTTTGVLSGTATAVTPTTMYTVSATNAGGQGSTKLTLTTINNPPAISYSPSSQTCTLGVAMTAMTPNNTGGAAVSYTVTPALPSGITLNTSTGVISGTPTVLSTSTNYTVTAFNSGGSSPVTVTLIVNPPAPAVPVISYNPDTLIFPINVAIAPVVPISTGGTVASYSHTGTFPAGLSFDTSTGILSGTPTVNSGQTTYTVTGTNISGSANTPLVLQVITVLPNPPAITYNPSNVAVTINQPSATLIPNNTGGTAVSWSISPTLPTGMTINTSTGLISGTPTVLSPVAPYTVTATNTGGSGQFTVNISVVSPPPGPVTKVHGKKAIYIH